MSGESPLSPCRRSGMGRTPCCDKVGMRRGPWTPQEDEILINYITTYGHGNWRVLPKRAGLLRCGKSCRLRWVNYLRPDIKRGNFTAEEMETVVKLHQELGNKWSMIAARLPGRTDNEIKNVWNAHLKKKKKKNARGSHPEDAPPETVVKCEASSDSDNQSDTKTGKYWENETSAAGEESLSEISTSSAAATEEEKEESFWSEVVAGDDLRAAAPKVYHSLVDFPYDLNVESGNDFWSDIY